MLLGCFWGGVKGGWGLQSCGDTQRHAVRGRDSRGESKKLKTRIKVTGTGRDQKEKAIVKEMLRNPL